MNLLTNAWIPIQNQGTLEKITLQQLLCGEKKGELCLLRDDFELACLQLISAITQVCFTPKDCQELKERLKRTLTLDEYLIGVEDKKSWFDLQHPETPFMQVRGVKASKSTPMDKLLVGVADGTNKSFVNPQELAGGLCGSCTAIALFNMAQNSPSMGGGFKGGLRGSTPITQLIKGPDLRTTTWLNVLSESHLRNVMPWYGETVMQQPNYVDIIKAGEKIPVNRIGLLRGVLWQPAHFELLPAKVSGCCSVCNSEAQLFTEFNKEKFNFTVEGTWPHPLSARTFKIVKGKREEKFPSFTTTAPGWTQLSRLVVARQTEKEGQSPAPVLLQAKTELVKANRLEFVIGGYRNNQATVLERRHEFFSLADGWSANDQLIHHIIDTGLAHKTALRKSLYLFAVGIKDKIKGSGVNLCESGDTLYFQQTEQLIHETLGTVDFSAPNTALTQLLEQLKRTVLVLFEQLTQPYCQEPKMLKAFALARRSLKKSLVDLQPITRKGM